MLLVKKIERYIDNLNDNIREDTGVKYVLCYENLFDEFCYDNELSYDELVETQDLNGSYWALWIKWAGINLSPDKLDDMTEETRDENAADLRTQAAEMGYHNYSSANGGTWYMD